MWGRRHAPDTPIVDRPEWPASYRRAEGKGSLTARGQAGGVLCLLEKESCSTSSSMQTNMAGNVLKVPLRPRSIVHMINYQDKRRSQKTVFSSVSDSCIHLRPAAPQQGTFTVRSISPRLRGRSMHNYATCLTDKRDSCKTRKKHQHFICDKDLKIQDRRKKI